MYKGKKPKKKFSQSFLNALQEGIWELVLFAIAFVVGGGILLLLGGTDFVTRMGLETPFLIRSFGPPSPRGKALRLRRIISYIQPHGFI